MRLSSSKPAVTGLPSASRTTHGTVNVLNLVQGEVAIVENPNGAFEPFVVRYAETFVIPAAVGGYMIRPGPRNGGAICATFKTFVREAE
jgi:hypothetical protein